MPPRSKRTVRDRRQLTDSQIYGLVTGHDFFCEWRDVHEPREAAYPRMREAWAVLGGELTALHVQQDPGTRPWAWWQFEMPEPRQLVGGFEHPESGFAPWHHLPGRSADDIHRLWPATFRRLWAEHQAGRSQRTYYFGRPNPLHAEGLNARYECQCTYLQRLGLLTPDEQRLMQSPDWQCWEEGESSWDHRGLSRDAIKQWLEGNA